MNLRLETLIDEAKEVIWRNQCIDPTHIEVEVDDDKKAIIINGVVATNEMKEEVERCCMGLKGVESVRNNLSVADYY